jgi:hypothetical protein
VADDAALGENRVDLTIEVDAVGCREGQCEKQGDEL